MLTGKSTNNVEGAIMLYAMRILIILVPLAFTGCVSDLSKKPIHSAMGDWNFKYQKTNGEWRTDLSMTIIDEMKATYTWENGRVYFDSADDQGLWHGHWVQNQANICLEEKFGSNHWGVAIFQFNDDYSKFEGVYDRCGKGQKFPFNGFQI
jgi:hypothetical protein